MRVAIGRVGLLVLVAAAPASAQTRIAAGASAGAVEFGDQRAEQALSAVVEYDPASWLSLSVIPSWLRVSDVVSGRSVSSSGLGDLPVVAAAWRRFAAPWSPAVGAALVLVLPTGDAACGLGNGTTAGGVDVGAAVAPGRAHLSADASRSISGPSAQSSLSAPRATALRVEAGYDVAPRWTAAASLGVDIGPADSGQALARVLGVGASHALAGPLILTLDAGHGLTAASPRWVLSVGVGTAYAGPSPVLPTTPLRRLGATFGRGVPRGGGAGKLGCR